MTTTPTPSDEQQARDLLDTIRACVRYALAAGEPTFSEDVDRMLNAAPPYVVGFALVMATFRLERDRLAYECPHGYDPDDCARWCEHRDTQDDEYDHALAEIADAREEDGE